MRTMFQESCRNRIQIAISIMSVRKKLRNLSVVTQKGRELCGVKGGGK